MKTFKEYLLKIETYEEDELAHYLAVKIAGLPSLIRLTPTNYQNQSPLQQMRPITRDSLLSALIRYMENLGMKNLQKQEWDWQRIRTLALHQINQFLGSLDAQNPEDKNIRRSSKVAEKIVDEAIGIMQQKWKAYAPSIHHQLYAHNPELN